MRPLTTFTHYGRRAIREARPAWDELLHWTQNAVIFSRPAWAEASYSVYGTRHPAVILEFRDGTLPVGLLPLQLTTFSGIGTRRLEFLSGGPPTLTQWLINPHHLGQSLYNDILTAPGYGDAVLRAVRCWLEAQSSHWDTLRLTCVPAESMLAQCFHELARGWSAHKVLDAKVFLDTSCGWEGYKARLSKRQRRHLRYEPNALERAVGAGLDLVTERGTESAAAVEIFLELHQRRWNARERWGVVPLEADRYRRLASSPGAGVVVHRLLAAGQTLAMQFGFDDGRRYIPYALAFDPMLERASPAQVLMHYVIRRCCEDDHAEVDLATLDAVHQWAGQSRLRAHLTACSPHLSAWVRARMLQASANGLAAVLRTNIGRRMRDRAGHVRYRWAPAGRQRLDKPQLHISDAPISSRR